jgi:hypothetical protein
MKTLAIVQVSLAIHSAHCGLLGPTFLEDNQKILEDGLDPAEFFRLKKIEQLKKRRKRRKFRRKYRSRSDLVISETKSGGSGKKSSGFRSEFLIPETYEPPPPDCNGGNGNLSGMTFMNFMMSAIAVAANLISNINSNQNNNNNNNNDNNDNVANFNFAANNNAANNQNTIAICE